MRLKVKLVAIIAVLAFWVTPAYAYIDPGTGSILLQGILGGIAAVITTLSFYWRRIKAYFSKSSKSEDTPKERM